jgi:branched-chain amino acid transport system permease protein
VTAFFFHFVAVYGSLINFIGINALLALSLYVTFWAGQLSLGNAAFAGIGAYTAGVLTMSFHAPYVVSISAGAVLAGVAALIIGLPVLRLRGVFLAMATLAFGEVVRIAAVNLQITGGAQGLVGIPNITNGWIIYGALVAVGYFLARLRGSRIGWSFESIREDETAAAAMGINTTYYKTLAFVIGAVIAGLTGAIYAHLNFIITPGEFGFSAAVQLLIYNIVGGTRIWYGPILGAVLLTALPEVLRGVGVTAGPIRMFVNGVILLLVILYLPNGLVSLFRRFGTFRGAKSDERAESAAEGGASRAA